MVSLNQSIIYEIVKFGERFEKEYLSKEFLRKKGVDIEKVFEDWWEALKFFLTRIFYQGRRDEISEKVETTVLEVLREFFNDPSKRDENFQSLMSENWYGLRRCLEEKIGKGKIGRGRDVDMVVDTLRFISRIQDKNIVNYSIRMINQGRIEELWNGLQKSKCKNGIRSIGEKIASLYLRDLVTVFHFEDKIPLNEQKYLQPLDTWVLQVIKRIGIREGNNENSDIIRQRIIEKCQQAGKSAIRFNEGAWYIGRHSFDILFEVLSCSASNPNSEKRICARPLYRGRAYMSDNFQ